MAWQREASEQLGDRVPDDVLHGILKVAARQPNHIAIKDLERSLSYGELVDECARVSAALTVRGVSMGERIGLILANSVDYIVAALSCLWVGAIFVPLDVQDSPQRIASLLEDCGPALVIALDESRKVFGDFIGGVPLMGLDHLATVEAIPRAPLPSDERPVYIIYTSGTTGTPKGVTIGNSAFSAAVESGSAGFTIDSDTRTLCVKPFHFDGSFATLFPTLVCGGTVVLRRRDSLLFPRVFFNTLIAESITNTGVTPSYLRSLIASSQFSELRHSTLSTLGLGGEAINAADLRVLWEVAPQIRVFNRYGPTETTIAVTQCEITPEMVRSGVIPIGRPHPGVEFVLLEEDGRVVASSMQPAELYIGGCQLMDGYWNAPVLTNEVLRRDFNGERLLYRTRDIAYRDSEGRYVYVERSDRVVKRGGSRISLAEITRAFQSCAVVHLAMTLAFDDGGTVGIVTFVVRREDLTTSDLHRWVRKRLPSWSLPDRIELIESIPLTKSGKTDEDLLLKSRGLSPVPKVNVPWAIRD